LARLSVVVGAAAHLIRCASACGTVLFVTRIRLDGDASTVWNCTMSSAPGEFALAGVVTTRFDPILPRVRRMRRRRFRILDRTEGFDYKADSHSWFW
jgi:hypothetical protein